MSEKLEGGSGSGAEHGWEVEESEARQVADRVGVAESHAKFNGKRVESFTMSPVDL